MKTPWFTKLALFVPAILLLVAHVFPLYAEEENQIPPPPEPTNPETPPEEPVTEEETTTSEEESDGGLLGDLIDLAEEIISPEQPPEIEPIEEPLEELVPIEPEVSIPNVVINKPLIPLRGEVNIKKKDIDYTNGSYLCEVAPFSSTVSSGSVHATVKIKNLNQVAGQARQLLIGELPDGFKIVFTNDAFSQNITGDQTEFSLSIIKSPSAQKGSFIVPIFYSVGTTKVMCQMNVVNNG